MLRLNVIVASTRPGRVGRHIADWFTEIAVQHDGFDVHMADLAEVNLPFHDEPNQPVDGGPYRHEHTLRWSAMTAAADAFVLVMPEYNRGYSAPLKNAIDYLYLEWLYKPVGFVSYGMASAGLRAVEMIKPVLTTLKMMPVPEAVSIHLRQALDADGHLVPTPGMATASKTMLDELHLLAGALAPIRKLA
jgi:NAD(P)H-dependent FMN reductase